MWALWRPLLKCRLHSQGWASSFWLVSIPVRVTGAPGRFSIPAAVVEIIVKRGNCAEKPLNITLVVALNPQPLVMLAYYCICEPKYLSFCNKQGGKTKLEFVLLLSLQSCLLTAPFVGGVQVSLGKHLRSNLSWICLYIPHFPSICFFGSKGFQSRIFVSSRKCQHFILPSSWELISCFQWMLMTIKHELVTLWTS